jgi:hypothetical protein
MRTAQFHNFTSKPFTGWWNGKSRVFQPGEKKFMPEYLARHFAKHLSNEVLNELGNPTACSPKFPEQVSAFMEQFNKAFTLQAGDDSDDDVDVAIDLANKAQGPASTIITKPNKPIGTTGELSTKTDEDDEDDYEGGDKDVE